jgi:SRSO17 transposase
MSAGFEMKRRLVPVSENDSGRISALTGHRKIALDSNVLIYLIETRGALADAAASIVDAVATGRVMAVMSAIGLVEILVGPARRGDAIAFESTADALRDIVREYALETLADETAVLVIDETGFLKQGKASCGVARQYTGSAGKITNCQIGVFASYVSRHGHAFIDRALYLPKEWTDDPARLKAAHVPHDVGFATKPQIARRMIARALAAKVPFAFVAADSVYGTGDIETMLRKAGKGYVLGVAANRVFRSWGKKQLIGGTAVKIAQNLAQSAWRRLSSGEGTKGPRLHDWAYLELADLDAAEYNSALTGEWTRGLLIRRSIADGALAFFSTWCPKGTPRKKLVSVEGHRWAIEDSFETAKNELGLDHNETRSWHGWHRHVSLVMLAFAMMAAIQHQANKPTPKKTKSSATPRHPTSSVGRSRKSAA